MTIMSSSDMMIHLAALCNAAEHDKVDKARSILEAHPDLRLDASNSDGFTPLDLAFMAGSRQLVLMLLAHKSDEADEVGRAISSIDFENHGQKLDSLIGESKKQVEKFGQLTKTGHAHLTASQMRECDKQRGLWQKRLAGLRKLKAGLEDAGRPHAPSTVDVSVTGPSQIQVKVHEPQLVGPHSLFTKLRVQWSRSDSFGQLEGERVVHCSSDEGQRLECLVQDLEEDSRYFVRASFGNPKGFGPFSAAQPKSVVPSSWRSLRPCQPRDPGPALRLMQNPNSAEYSTEDSTAQQGMPFKGLMLLLGGPKLQRTVHPHKVYLCCVLFHEDRVLTTNEESLPLVAVDDVAALHNAQAELHWLSKLCHQWSEVPRLRSQLAKAASSVDNHSQLSFRLKLLNAVASMQTALSGLGGDLGTVYHSPFHMHGGSSVVYSLVRHVRYAKSVVSLSLKWVPMSKAQKGDEEERLLRSSIRQQILFHQVSSLKMSRGLYVCYLQARSSVGQGTQIVVSNTSPSILPYAKIRDNNHVTADEWSWLLQLSKLQQRRKVSSVLHAPSPTTNFLTGEGEEGSDWIAAAESSSLRPTEEQYAFGKQIATSISRLFDYLEVSQRPSHRIYDGEILELSPQVSVILVLPPPHKVVYLDTKNNDSSCVDLSKRNDLLCLPLSTFELLHVGTYHSQMLASYLRVSASLELDLVLGKQAQREAFDPEDSNEAQSKLAALLGQQQDLEEAWRPMRWLPDVLTAARSKTSKAITYEQLKEWYDNQSEVPDDSAVFAKPSSEVVVSLSRTPTTRSDPCSEFEDKENNQGLRQVSSYHVGATSSSGSEVKTNVLQVYAAYDTGLASGTSVRLNVTRDTCAREVIDLVIRQLNMAVILKGRDGPVYENDKLRSFCLVAVIGSRERCLRDDFKPLNLQNPWKSGKLFVRMKNDVLAAIERINSSSMLKTDAVMSSSVPNVSSASRHTTTVL